MSDLTVLKLKNFHHQTIANLPYNATEIVRFLKYVRKLGVIKKVGFFEKKLKFFKIGKGGKFADDIIFKMSVPP